MDVLNDAMFTFTWKIENFWCGFARNGKFYASPRFVAENVSDCEWNLLLFPDGDIHVEKGFISCFLWGKGSSTTKNIQYKFEILDKDENVTFSTHCKHPVLLSSKYLVSSYTVTLNQFRDDMNYATFYLRLRFNGKNQKQNSSLEAMGKTRFISTKYSFIWKINTHDELVKKCFQCQEVTYCIELNRSKNIFEIKAKEYLGEDHCLTCRFSLVDIEGEEKAVQAVTYMFKDPDDDLQFPIFYLNETPPSKTHQYMQDNISLSCDFFFPSETYATSLEHIDRNLPMVDNPQTKSSKSFAEEYQKMYMDKVFSDVEFRIGKEVLSAHRSVLSIRSPVFLAMFSLDMAEKQYGVVEITDTDPETFDLFLRYFYTGEVDNMDSEKALKLLVLGDRYDVNSLVAKCTVFLAFNISTENAVDVLRTADATHQTNLKKSAVSYIKSHASTVLKSDQWKQLSASNIGLATDIIAVLSEDLSVVP